MRIKQKGLVSKPDAIRRKVERIIDLYYKFSYTPVDRCVYKKMREYLVSDLMEKVIEPILFYNRVIDDADQVKTWPKWKQDTIISADAALTGRFVKRGSNKRRGGQRDD
jgi:hypothetical protein